MSDDLISRQAVRFVEMDGKKEHPTFNLDDAYEQGFEDCLEKVLALPSIDAVQVIRCKDCKYYKENTLVCSRYGLEDDDYCSWAERKES